MSTDSDRQERTIVSLPTVLVQRVKKRLGNSNFKSVDDYVAYVVEQMLNELEPTENSKTNEAVFSKKDQEDIEQRLRDLGYL